MFSGRPEAKHRQRQSNWLLGVRERKRGPEAGESKLVPGV